jgi:hypothetical protein
MATREEMVAAVNAALAAEQPPVSDAREVERFVAMWQAMLPFAPKPKTSAVVVVGFEPEGEGEEADLAEIEAKTRSLLRKIDQRTPE